MKTVAGGLVLAMVLIVARPARAQIFLYAPEKGIVPGVVLNDQFGQHHTAAALRGDVVAFVYGDQLVSAANRALAGELHAAFHPTARGKPPAERGGLRCGRWKAPRGGRASRTSTSCRWPASAR